MRPTVLPRTDRCLPIISTDPPYAAREVCEGIHYERICDSSLLVAFLHSLPAWLADHSAVSPPVRDPGDRTDYLYQTKLVVIDSLTTYLRPTALDISTRKMILSLIASTLSLLTSVNSISVSVPPAHSDSYSPVCRSSQRLNCPSSSSHQRLDCPRDSREMQNLSWYQVSEWRGSEDRVGVSRCTSTRMEEGMSLFISPRSRMLTTVVEWHIS